jgi:outer membrane protein assembly factor BamB
MPRLQDWKGYTAFLMSAVSAGVICAAQDRQLDYPQWRGTNRDGSASGFVQPTVWPDVLTRRWRVEVGEGYASPIVVGNTVYVFSRREGREVLSAFDVANGTERWQAGYPAPYTPDKATAAHGSGPKATPLFHDGKIITLGISGVVAAWDVERGALLWRTAEPKEVPVFSAASSPVGDGRLAITHPGNYGPLTAFDTESGRVTWTAGGDGFFMSPIVATLHGVRQIISVTHAAVVGVAADEGRLLWEYPWTGGRSGGIMPVLYRDSLIVSAHTAGAVSITPRLRDGNWFVEKLWEAPTAEMYISHPVVVGDTLFGFSRRNRGQLFALDARDGRVLWLGEPRFATNVALAKADDMLFVLKDDGTLIIASASSSGFEPMRTFQVADRSTWAQPVVSGRRLFVKDLSALTLWTFD